jgi:hypothetical protein
MSSASSSAESDSQLNSNSNTKTTSDAAASSSSAPTVAIPKDKVNLRLLLTNGKRSDFLFNPTASVEQIKQHIFENWPNGLF